MRPLTIHQQAIIYRKRGYSYNMISRRLSLAKSTLSNWLREIPYKPNKEVINKVGRARMKSAQFKMNQKLANIKMMKQIAKRELGKVSERDLWFLGIGLYIGEGSKLYENIRLINSDPQIILLALKWFENICGLKKENFRPEVHIYPDIDIDKAVRYWSSLTKIPRNQFGKTQVDKRTSKSLKKKRKLPYGTLHLAVRSNRKKEFGVSLHRRIVGWIEAVYKQIK